MNIPFVDLKAQYQSIKMEMDTAIHNIVEDATFIGGNPVVEFERSFADFIGVDHCIGCGNCTDAMEIILKCLEIGVGDEVIVPANSWIATSEAVTSVGGNPVFVDILPGLYTIDPDDILRKITAKTKAVIPVHLYGLPAPMDRIMKIAEDHELKVIEDCAQAHGASVGQQKVGSFGHASAYSFYPSKNMGAYGDSGAMVTNDPELSDKLRMMANHGQLTKHQHQMEGRNSRLDTLQAAILKVKLSHLDHWNQSRIHNAAHYQQLLNGRNIRLPEVPEHYQHVFHLYVVQVENRDEVMNGLKSSGVHCAIHYPTPLPFLPAYHKKGHKPEDFPVVHQNERKILSLPMYPELSESQIDYVSNCLIDLL